MSLLGKQHEGHVHFTLCISQNENGDVQLEIYPEGEPDLIVRGVVLFVGMIGAKVAESGPEGLEAMIRFMATSPS